jgi:hypothetical protein
VRLDGILLGRITHISSGRVEQGIDDMYMIHHVLGWWLVLLESGLIDNKSNNRGRNRHRRIVEAFANTITAQKIVFQFEPTFQNYPPQSAAEVKEEGRPLISYPFAFDDLVKTWLRRARLLHTESEALVTLATDSTLNIMDQYRMIAAKCSRDENILPNARPEVRRVHQLMEGRAFFVTDSGHMGIGSMWAAVGDVVGIPFGADNPFVFRFHADTERMEGEQYVSLVSDCYVDGVMHGEVFDYSGYTQCTFVVE